MDELVHHCLRELSFDGDLGGDVSRLRDFIAGFYARSFESPPQNVDDAFCAFFWNVIVQQPTVRVGTVPQGGTAEVYIAPQISAKRKAKARGEEHVEETPPVLDSIADVESKSLDQLNSEYGERLRIAVDPETSFAAITGSHLRSPKLSPMVYTTLQFITRSREAGITVVDLGKKSGYDQKACFYLIKQLLDLDLVVKVKHGTAGSHLIIHKYFYEGSPLWQKIKSEEMEDRVEIGQSEPSQSLEQSSSSVQVYFEPMDGRHLASLPLVRSRVVKLLKSSKNNMHESHNMLNTIGFANPTKTDRRTFQSKIRELIQQGLLEKVLVSKTTDKGRDTTITCLRLVPLGSAQQLEGEGLIQVSEVDDEPEEANKLEELKRVKMNVTIQKQIVDLLEEAGFSGMTLHEISFALAHLDKRTVELLLARAEKNPPPSHLSDLGIAELMETHGRERRHRYYTVAAYRSVVARENLDPSNAGYANVDFTNVGEFTQNDSSLFYENDDALSIYIEHFSDRKVNPGALRPRKRPPKNPILPDGTVKRGRPRKTDPDILTRKRKRAEGDDRDAESQKEQPERRSKRKKGEAEILNAAASVEKELPNMNAQESTVTVPTIQLDNAIPIDPALMLEVEPDLALEMSPSLAIESSPASRTKVNVSHLRRENEIHRLLEKFGGIINASSKEFYDAHLVLLEEMAQAGEPTSAPIGTRLDKRTVAMTLNNMELRGRIKTIKTSVNTFAGASRPVSIIYEPNLPEDKIAVYLAALSNSVAPSPQQQLVRKIDEHIDYGTDTKRPKRWHAPLQLLQEERPRDDDKERWTKNVVRADQLFAHDESKIKEVLLMERTTLAQLYGFMVGKMARTRELHLHSIDMLEKGTSSIHIVSAEKRIIHISHYCQDIPLAVYCSVLATLEHNENLHEFLNTDAGGKTPVKDVPIQFQNLLQVGKSRARARFLDLLLVLQHLKLVTPLSASQSTSPWISCAPNGENPICFDMASMDGWSASNSMSAPVYWHFHSAAPVHLWAVSDATPPLLKEFPIQSHAECLSYWTALKNACLDREVVTTFEPSAPTLSTDPSEERHTPARSLRRPSSWNRDYVLTWHQRRYLQKFIDQFTAATIQEGGDHSLIERISWVISAPRSVVSGFFSEEKPVTEKKTVGRKPHRLSTEDEAKKASEAKALLAKKATEAKAQREKAWEDLINRLYPQGLQGSAALCVRRIRARFVQSGPYKDTKSWEEEIEKAIAEARLTTANIFKTKSPFLENQSVSAVPSALALNVSEKAIEDLVARQGPPRNEIKKRREKGKGKAVGEGEMKVVHKRHRFQWNQDYEELALDASAIIKARCRNSPRLDLAALEQVFPAVPRNTVRHRLACLRTLPGNDVYMTRLEDKWYEVWVQHRGTPLLPDSDPQHPSNFNLIKHIGFLRKSIDKNALRMGLSNTEEGPFVNLPESIDQLYQEWDIIEGIDTAAPMYDFLWNTSMEEGREKQLLRRCFSEEVQSIPAIDTYSDTVRLAESALKMVLGTSNDIYNPQEASRLLHNLGEGFVATAAMNLLNRGVLSKTDKNAWTRAGRIFKISDLNQNALGGSIPRETFQDASALEEEMVGGGDEWREWWLLATDGDIAALLQLTSQHEMDFNIDLTQSMSARAQIDWNSKKADDDHVENAIFARLRVVESATREEPLGPENLPNAQITELEESTVSGHGLTDTGEVASCKRQSEGLVDCTTCLQESESALLSILSADVAPLASAVLTVVRQTAGKGIKKEELFASVDDESTERVLATVRQMTDASPPLVFWAGYTSAVLVCSSFLRSWTVVVSENPRIRVFPHRWCNMYGVKIDYLWQAALKAVIGVVLFRPGVSQAEIRWRLRAVYDRLETIELLQYLEDSKFLKRRIGYLAEVLLPVKALGEEEEKVTFWFIGDRHWYQV